MIKVGDIYCNREGILVVVNQVRAYPGSNAYNTYLDLSYAGRDSWYGVWEQNWFLGQFRPATKLDKLLAGI